LLWRKPKVIDLREEVDPLAKYQLVIPAVLKERVMKLGHDDEHMGHMGVKKTQYIISRNFYWPSMKSDIRKFVNKCHICEQFRSTNHPSYGKMGHVTVSKAFSTVSVDLIGPLPRSVNAYTYILVIVDAFTRWVQLFPLTRPTSGAIINKLVQFTSQFGCPQKLLSDNASYFTSKSFRNFCKSKGMQHVLISKYHAQANQTERHNQIFEHMVRKYIMSNHRNWVKFIPQLQFALNNQLNESIGCPSALLVYGRHMRAPGEISFSDIPEVIKGDYQVFQDELECRLNHCTEKAQEAQEKMWRKNKVQYDRKRRDTDYAIGSLVWLKTHPKSDADRGVVGKFCPKYAGPFKVAKKISPLSYLLGYVDGDAIKGKYHVSHLKPYLSEVNEVISGNESESESNGNQPVQQPNRRSRRERRQTKWFGNPLW